MKTIKQKIGLAICIIAIYCALFVMLIIASRGDVFGTLLFLGGVTFFGLLVMLGIHLMGEPK